MACQCAPALLQLRDEINARWPKRDKSSDGCCASSGHHQQNPSSDHEPGAKGATPGYAHAYDIDEDLDAGTHSLGFLVPILLADSRCKYVIYEKRIHYPDGTSKTYTGVNPHDKHLHVSIKPKSTFETRSWLGPLDQPPPEEDDMPSPAIVWINGIRFVFVLAEGGIWWKQGDGGFARIPGGKLTSSPGATVNGQSIEVVARGTDGATWSVTRSPQGAWGQWVSLGGKS